MYTNISAEDLAAIAEISGRLGSGWSFKSTYYLHGIQCNWKKDGVSVMWRNKDGDPRSVERYEKAKSMHPEMLYIEEL